MRYFIADIFPSLYKGIPRDPSTHELKFTSIKQIIIILGNIIEILLVLIGILAVIYVIYASILYIISQGEPAKTASAKTALIHAVIGVLLSGGAYLIIEFLARGLQ